MMPLVKKYLNKSFVIWSLIFLFGVFLTLNKNSKRESGIGSYQSEFWADKGGYYIYLPYAFIADFDAGKLPDNIEESTGNSFEIRKDRLTSKYMIGVAILQTPFFLIAHGVAKLSYNKPTGFEKV